METKEKNLEQDSREGDIVLTECPNVDPDTGCRYTIKKYHSEKVGSDGSW